MSTKLIPKYEITKTAVYLLDLPRPINIGHNIINEIR